jgi:hypothetical protein
MEEMSEVKLLNVMKPAPNTMDAQAADSSHSVTQQDAPCSPTPHSSPEAADNTSADGRAAVQDPYQ